MYNVNMINLINKDTYMRIYKKSGEYRSAYPGYTGYPGYIVDKVSDVVSKVSIYNEPINDRVNELLYRNHISFKRIKGYLVFYFYNPYYYVSDMPNNTHHIMCDVLRLKKKNRNKNKK